MIFSDTEDALEQVRVNDPAAELKMPVGLDCAEKKSAGKCPESCKIVKAHMIEADIPEEGSEYVRMAKEAGFSRTELSLEEASGLGILFAHA
jgi:hypothetical protein